MAAEVRNGSQRVLVFEYFFRQMMKDLDFPVFVSSVSDIS